MALTPVVVLLAAAFTYRGYWEKTERRGGTTFEDANGGGEVVDATGSLEGGGENFDGGDEVVGEAVVQVALGGVSESLIVSGERKGRE